MVGVFIKETSEVIASDRMKRKEIRGEYRRRIYDKLNGAGMMARDGIYLYIYCISKM